KRVWGSSGGAPGRAGGWVFSLGGGRRGCARFFLAPRVSGVWGGLPRGPRVSRVVGWGAAAPPVLRGGFSVFWGGRSFLLGWGCLRLGGGSGWPADGPHNPATPGAHPCRRAAATLAVWRRVQRLLRPDITADSRALLAIRARALAHPRRIVAVSRIKPNQPFL